MRATIRSVAKLAGVAPSTVSHYLNQTATISPNTAQSVERAIAALKYQVHLGARSLRSRKTHSVGLVIPNITTPFFGELAAIIENMLWDRGYQMLLCISERDIEREVVQVATLTSRQVDGILMIYNNEASQVLQTVDELPVPMVFVDRPVPGRNSVATDNFFGGRLAARHLLSLGHRCFAFLCGEAEIRNAADRIEGFRYELRLSGLDVSADYFVHGRQELQLGAKISELLKLHPCPTAVFATNDIVAIGAWPTLAERGYRVPQDISIVGFDDIEVSRYLVPSLTTVAQPTREIGIRAVDMLLKTITQSDQQRAAPSCIFVSPTLKIRGSTARPPERR
ncbi:MAG TPA: LacI family DNA-binding transcriptional regulator [Chthoniobacterales bacterium]|nr:LacI family DNA-binding transcriptional regulator [Chthoniobacterales bacterium]